MLNFRVSWIRLFLKYFGFFLMHPIEEEICIQFVTSPLQESRLLWLHDQHPRQPSRVSETIDQVPRNNISVPRNNNIVPRNNTVPQFCDAHVRSPLENLSSSTW